MHVSGIMYDSIVDGLGLRNTIFVSGCYHKCKHCHNTETWSFTYGKEFDISRQDKFIEDCKINPLLSGLTVSGGDPFYSSKDLIPFIRKYKKEIPSHDIWIYSGFTFEEIISDPIKLDLLRECDILVDGKFEEDKKTLTCRFRGSSNQRIIDVQESLKQNKIILYME